MRYPAFLKKQDGIGVTAPSAGVDLQDHAGLDLSLSHLRAAGWRVQETNNVRAGGLVSAPAEERAAQLNALLHDPDIRMIWCACGGDFLLDMLPFVDWKTADSHPKWVQGYSDPTSLLYVLTTWLDIATIYGTNAGGFDTEVLPPFLQTNLALLQGTLTPQHSFETFTHWANEDGAQPVVWETPRGDVDVTGRLIGGCLDCLSDLLGTPWDHTAAFVERYKDDGILWYFDIFSLSAEAVYRTLWRMRACGWFRHASGVMVGRVCFPNSQAAVTYHDMICRALPDLPVVFEADVGHVPPRMTMINGAVAHLQAANGIGTLGMSLK